jgi:hypothetical protein
MSKETKTKGDVDGSNTCPFTETELEKIQGLLEEQFEKEKQSAASDDGQIRCPLTGQRVCFCKCGPHLLCPEHHLNCRWCWNGDYPDDLDNLLVKWLKWQAGDVLSDEE